MKKVESRYDIKFVVGVGPKTLSQMNAVAGRAAQAGLSTRRTKSEVDSDNITLYDMRHTRCVTQRRFRAKCLILLGH